MDAKTKRLTVEQVRKQCIESQKKGQSLGAVMAWAFSLDRSWGSVEVRKVWFETADGR